MDKNIGQIPDFLKSYFGLLKFANFGKDDNDRLNFALTLAIKAISHGVLLVVFDAALSPEQQRVLKMPERPVLVSPLNEKILSFFTNRKEVERLISETNLTTHRLIFSRVEPGKLIMDCPKLNELLDCVAIADQVGVPIEKSLASRGFG